jgi:hypothetical protein
MSSTLNIYPNNLFDLRRFEAMLLLEHGQLDNLTFIPTYKKLGVSIDKISNSRIMDGLFNKHKKYCPECLEEIYAHKLIWQVDEVNSCNIHKVRLISSCWNCNKQIPILPSIPLLCKCPYCNSDLRNAPRIETIFSSYDLRSYSDWELLLGPNDYRLETNNNLSTGQSMALKLLIILEDNNLCIKNMNFIPQSSILNLARNNKIEQSFISLDTVLRILRACNVSMETFLTTEVPVGFIKSLCISKKIAPIKEFACMAPWCKGYLKPGTLKRTGTLKKSLGDGHVYSFYMFCSKCGVKYSIRYEDSTLVERGYFIELAWN